MKIDKIKAEDIHKVFRDGKLPQGFVEAFRKKLVLDRLTDFDPIEESRKYSDFLKRQQSLWARTLSVVSLRPRTNRYELARYRAQEFIDKVRDFVFAFQFASRPEDLKNHDRDRLFEATTLEMTAVAQEIKRLETKSDVSKLKHQFKLMSDAANALGLGQRWSVYFNSIE